MDHPVVHFSTVFMAFFAVMNPIANAPLFLTLTDGMDVPTRRSVAIRSVLLAFVIITAFAVGGRVIFSIFGITLPAFRIAGGILVALVGYHMLQGGIIRVFIPPLNRILRRVAMPPSAWRSPRWQCPFWRERAPLPRP